MTPQQLAQLQDACAKSRWTKALGPLAWPQFFALLELPARTTLEVQLYWKLLARRLPVNQYYKQETGQFRGCTRCNAPLESIEHVFFECPAVPDFWVAFRALFGAIVGMSAMELPLVSLRDVIFFFPELRASLCPEEVHALQVMHSVAIWVLWGARSLQPSASLIWSSFVNRLQARLAIEYEAAVAFDAENDRASYAFSAVSTAFDDQTNSPTTPTSSTVSSESLNGFNRRRRGSSSNVPLSAIREFTGQTPLYPTPGSPVPGYLPTLPPSSPVSTVRGFVTTWCSSTSSPIMVTPSGLKFKNMAMPSPSASPSA
eukprot:jgi/Hompol1/6091/HPOL_000351-RA